MGFFTKNPPTNAPFSPAFSIPPPPSSASSSSSSSSPPPFLSPLVAMDSSSTISSSSSTDAVISPLTTRVASSSSSSSPPPFLSPLVVMDSSSTISSSSSTDAVISPLTTRVGWIGTGVMGAAMAGHLLAAGYSLTVFNRTASKAQPLVSRGARLAPSPSSLAASSDVVFLIVGFPSDVRLLVDGLLPHLSPGSVLIDMTTSEPSLARDISSAASYAGVHSIDAPVSGGDVGARNATLSIFAGGDQMVVRRLSPLFNLMGKVNYMGGPGLGQCAKLGNQITIASTLVGLVEGMVYAHKAGLDVERWMEAISKGAAGSRSLELFGKRILERDLAEGSHVKHFVKDLGICLKECERMGLALPGLALVQQLYLSLVANGEEGLGMQALVLAVERLNNVRLTKKKEEEEEGKSG